MPDIRDVLKGLSPDDRALYTEIRTIMRRAYLAAHARVLPIDKYETTDDAFLDLIDIKLAMLFDRAGVFDHSDGNLDNVAANKISLQLEADGRSAATRLMQQPLDQQKVAWPNGNGNGK